MHQGRFNLLVVCVAALAAVACERKPAAGGTHYYIFPDRSGSIPVKQTAEWLKAADKLGARLQSGDAVTIIPVHANTTSAPVLFDAASDSVDEDAGFEVTQKAVADLASMREGLQRVMETVFATPGTSPETDLFGVVDRIHADPAGRHIVIAVLSDMEHSTPELDMGRVRITDRETPGLIQAAAKLHRWQGSELAGATVMCILPSHDGKTRTPRNDIPTLKRFWSVFFDALGAEVAVFDTHI